MIELSEQQRLDLTDSAIPRAIDPSTRQKYVLVREEVFEQIKQLLSGHFQASDAYGAIDRAFADGWNDPRMDDYDRYEELKK